MLARDQRDGVATGRILRLEKWKGEVEGSSTAPAARVVATHCTHLDANEHSDNYFVCRDADGC